MYTCVFTFRCCVSVDSNVSTNTTPLDEERAFEQSDTDDMSELSGQLVPRGIVNPNYPGFQHLAHTLQVMFPQTKESLEMFPLLGTQGKP